ncbi:hypothetical protein [Piscirickettsia litoralis]|nr:hypothetical protein [Piscirickettsia litoralis]
MTKKSIEPVGFAEILNQSFDHKSQDIAQMIRDFLNNFLHLSHVLF